jgi:hypothetical protein
LFISRCHLSECPIDSLVICRIDSWFIDFWFSVAIKINRISRYVECFCDLFRIRRKIETECYWSDNIIQIRNKCP